MRLALSKALYAAARVALELGAPATSQGIGAKRPTALDRLCTHILAFEGNSHVEWFEGNLESYEEDKRRRLGDEADRPTRMSYKKLTR